MTGPSYGGPNYGGSQFGGPYFAGTPPAKRKQKPNRFVSAGLTTFTFLVVLWVVHIVNAFMHHRLIYYGIRPGDTDGLWGILFAPFIHVDFTHLVMNSSAVAILLFVLALSGQREVWISSIIIALVAGGAVWYFGNPYTVHVGASGLIYGWMAYLIVRGFFTRNATQIMLGIIIGFSYAGSVWGMLPGQEGVSWQGHLFGAIGGVIAAASGVASNKKDNDQLLAPQRGINHGR